MEDLTNAIFSKRSTMDRSIVTVDRFDRTVMIKNPLNTDVLHRL